MMCRAAHVPLPESVRLVGVSCPQQVPGKPEFASRLGGWLILGQTRAGEHRGTGSHTRSGRTQNVPGRSHTPRPARTATRPARLGRLHAPPGSDGYTPRPAPEARPAQRSAARIAPSMSGKANEKPESSSFAGITR
ncbi:hypothetical protein GCM10010264_27900 [Streptomyces globisporus]|nr:hypothetical protein GCM10010264_27900 [Streptomyces globisporus]